MKRCPECRRDYTDETLNYCLDDGAALLDGPASETRIGDTPTAVLAAEQIPRDAATFVHEEGGTKILSPEHRATSVSNSGREGIPNWMIGVALIALITGAAGYWLLENREVDRQASSSPQPKLTQITFADGIEEFPSWSPDGTKVAYSGEVGGVRKIFLKDLGTSEERQLTQGGDDDIQPAWSPDGATILFVRAQKASEKLQPVDVFGAFEGGDIWSVEIATRSESRLIDNAYNPSYSPDGKYIAYDASRSGPRRVYTSDSKGYNSQQISTDTSEEVSHVRPRWSTDGKRIVFQNIERTRFNIRTVEVDGRRMTWITNDLNNNLNPVWSRKNNFIYFSSDRGGGYNIWRAGLSTAGEPVGQPQQVTTGAGQDVELAISSNGQHLGFAVLQQNADLWRLPVSPANGKPTGPPEEVISTTREDSRGSISPDGSRIAFNSDRSGDMNIWLFSFGDRSTRQLTRGPGGDFQPTWSPDGKQVVFFSSRNGNADIWKFDLETGSLLQVTQDAATDVNPFFSPDGRTIAYQSDRTGRTEIWLINADGSGERQLTRVGVRGHFIRWNKLGDGVVFRAVTANGWRVCEAPIDGGPLTELPNVTGGGHLSFNHTHSALADVTAHKTLWSSPVGTGGAPEKIFEFPDADVRIDYPVWSPDGKWILFDRFRPVSGDIWMIENFE